MDLKKPRFSGLPQDMAQVTRDWNEVQAIIGQASAHPVSDYAMLMELRKALEDASDEVLKARMANEPDLRYYEVWNPFQQEWCVDASKQNRSDWHAATLTAKGPKEDSVTLKDWRRHQDRLITTRSRSVDRTVFLPTDDLDAVRALQGAIEEAPLTPLGKPSGAREH